MNRTHCLRKHTHTQQYTGRELNHTAVCVKRTDQLQPCKHGVSVCVGGREKGAKGCFSGSQNREVKIREMLFHAPILLLYRATPPPPVCALALPSLPCRANEIDPFFGSEKERDPMSRLRMLPEETGQRGPS